MDQQPSDLLKLAWGWGRRREELPGSVAGLDHDHWRTVARSQGARTACAERLPRLSLAVWRRAVSTRWAGWFSGGPHALLDAAHLVSYVLVAVFLWRKPGRPGPAAACRQRRHRLQIVLIVRFPTTLPCWVICAGSAHAAPIVVRPGGTTFFFAPCSGRRVGFCRCHTVRPDVRLDCLYPVLHRPLRDSCSKAVALMAVRQTRSGSCSSSWPGCPLRSTRASRAGNGAGLLAMNGLHRWRTRLPAVLGRAGGGRAPSHAWPGEREGHRRAVMDVTAGAR